MGTNWEFLARIGRIPPAAWDFIVPRGPVRESIALETRRELREVDVVAVAAVELAQTITHQAVTMQAQGQPASGWLRDVIDDWCGTRWPRPWPWPPGFDPDPDPNPWYADHFRTGQLAAAVVFASAASRMRDGDLSKTLGDGAERLADAAMGAASVKVPAKRRTAVRR